MIGQDYRAATTTPGARALCRSCRWSGWEPERQRLQCTNPHRPPWAYYCPNVPTCAYYQREPGSDDE